mgnify:CR=1 FL=1
MLKRLLAVTAAMLLTIATAAVAAELAGDHPTTYTVKKGDTLWDIAGRFLKKPWLWPEIWQANPQVKNPHLIYPGDVLSLVYIDGKPVVQTEGPQIGEAVNTIPLSDIEPFLKQFTVLDDIESLPYVVGLEEDRLRGSNGQVAYVRGLDGIAPGQRYLVVRPEKRYRHVDRSGYCCDLFQSEDLDPRGQPMREAGTMWSNIVFPSKSTEFIGYELMTQSTGTVTRGEVAGIQASTLLLDSEGREVRVGGEPLVLPRRELALLELLVQRAGRVVQRGHLDSELYGFGVDVSPNALETQVSRLRRRLQDADAGVEVQTIRGVGYMLRPC